MTTTESLAPAIELPSYTIPAFRLAEFQAKVAKFNLHLAKNDIAASFDFTYEETQKRAYRNGVAIIPAVFETWIVATLTSALTITLGDFTFMAALVAEEAGVTVHTAPGQELGGYVPVGDTHCDHCGVARDRVRLYIVRDNTNGELVQLGHSCIELYTGYSPKGLSALQYDDELAAIQSDGGGSFGARDLSLAVDDVIAASFAYSGSGRDYVSTKIEWKTPTSAKVKDHLYNGAPRRLNFKYEADFYLAVEEYDAKVAEIATIKADAVLMDAIKASGLALDADSDYGRNLQVILAGETVSYRNVGILASIVSVYSREQSLRAQREARPVAVKGFLAPVGTRIKTPIELSLITVKISEGNYGMTTWIVGVTPEGLTVSWSASKVIDVEVGGTLVLKAATVKAHKDYKGTDQTIITRAVIAE